MPYQILRFKVFIFFLFFGNDLKNTEEYHLQKTSCSNSTFLWCLWQEPQEMQVVVPLTSSLHHVELNLKSSSKNARYELMALVKEIAGNHACTPESDKTLKTDYKGWRHSSHLINLILIKSNWILSDCSSNRSPRGWQTRRQCAALDKMDNGLLYGCL